MSIRFYRRKFLLGTLAFTLTVPKVFSAPTSKSRTMDDSRLERFRRRYSSRKRLPGNRSEPYLLDTDSGGAQSWASIHEGKGSVGVKVFSFERGSLPTSFLTYDIPPFASEGVHTHRLDDPVEGSFDEFYYIVAGQGQMAIGDAIVPVKEGDHVFTPIGVPHGIENTSSTENLKVFLTYIYR